MLCNKRVFCLYRIYKWVIKYIEFDFYYYELEILNNISYKIFVVVKIMVFLMAFIF